MPITRNTLDPARFNPQAKLPYELRIEDFRLAAQDVYDFFYDVTPASPRRDSIGSTTPCGRRSCPASCPTC